MCEEGIGGAVKLWHGDDIFSVLGEIENSKVQRGLSGTYAECADSPLERRNAGLQHIICGVADTAVSMPGNLQIEQGRAMFGAIERIGDRLIDRHGYCPCGRINVVSAMDRDRFSPHCDELSSSGPQSTSV